MESSRTIQTPNIYRLSRASPNMLIDADLMDVFQAQYPRPVVW